MRAVRFALRLIFIVGVAALPATSGAANPEPGQNSRAQIEQIEEELQNLAGERWRLRHRIEYGNEEAGALRKEAKQLEAELLAARNALRDHLRINYPDVANQRKELARQSALIRGLKEEAAVLERELASAFHSADSETEMDELKEELQGLREKIASEEKTARELGEKLSDLGSMIGMEDEPGKELVEHVSRLEREHADILSQMNRLIDGQEEVVQLEQARRELARELEELRRQ